MRGKRLLRSSYNQFYQYHRDLLKLTTQPHIYGLENAPLRWIEKADMNTKSNMLDFMSAFSDACAKVSSLEALAIVLKDSFQDLSVKMFSYIHCPPLGATDYAPSEVVTHFGYPRRWTYFYKTRECCQFDPFVEHAFKKNSAFKWSEVTGAPSEDPSIKEFIQEVKSLGINEGYAFPVFGAKYRSGFFTLGFDENASPLNSFQLSMLQWACQLAHYRFVELKTQNDDAHTALTPREKEVLKYVSLGQSNSEIAKVLDISRHTIDGYLKNIYIKLGVAERVSASHRAVALGLL